MILSLLDRRSVRFACAAISGLLLASVLGLHPLWWVAWIAPVPLLAASLRASEKESWVLGFLAGLVGQATGFSYLSSVTGAALAAIFTLLNALLWAFILMRARALTVRSNHWLAPFAYPALWAGVETVVAAVSPHSSWGSQAYAQMDALAVIQVASLAGPTGVTFLVCLFASTVSLVLVRGGEIPRPWLVYGLPAVVLAMALGWGAWRVSTSQPAETVPVGMVAIDDYIGVKTPKGVSDAIWNRYSDATRELARGGARIVVLPEKIAVLNPEAAAHVRTLLAGTVREYGVYVLAGVELTGAGHYNQAWLFSPAGELAAEYDKRHMVPGLESHLAPGHTPLVVSIDARRYGIAICKDMHFPSLGRDNGALGVSAMLVPAWDFDDDAWYTARLTALRGVENGYTVIRASKQGLLSVSDRYGRVLTELRSRKMPGALLPAIAPVATPILTLYTRVGDAFGWLCLAGAVLALALNWHKRRQTL